MLLSILAEKKAISVRSFHKAGRKRKVPRLYPTEVLEDIENEELSNEAKELEPTYN